jgi:hypothetical protein
MSRRIFVVEEQEALRAILRELLSASGYAVIAVRRSSIVAV